MADNTELPNVDIFDPIQCVKMWNRCATQQEINVYLNKQIELNRSVLTDTIKAQNEINASNKTTLADHTKRIASLESGLAALDKAQSDLNTAFQALQTDNNNFKSNVDLLLNQYQTTINLLQQNVDKISVSNEQLWNEVNKLKSQFDPDKLDAAIAGYDSVLKDAKKYADDLNADLISRMDAFDKEFASFKLENDSNIKAIQSNWNNRLSNLENSTATEFTVIRGGLETFMNQVNSTNAAQRQWLETEIARVNKRIDNLDNKVEKYQEANANTHTDLKNQIAAVKKEAADNLQARYDELDAFIKQVQETEQTNTASLQDDINNVRKEYARDIKTAQDELQSQIDALKTSDGKQWDTVNGILEAQNRINDNMEALYKYVNEQIELVQSDITDLKSGVAELETGKQAIELRAEYLEQRTGWKYRAVAKAGDRDTVVYDVGFGKLTFTIAAAQVQFAFTLNDGISGVISIPATNYGRFQPITANTFNSITRATDAQFIQGYIFNYANSRCPVMFVIYYEPTSQEVTFLSQYETNADVMPKSGNTPQTVK